MKYSEAKKAVEALSSKYSVNEFCGYFSVNIRGTEIAFVISNERYSYNIWNKCSFQKLPFSNKLYMILSELAMTPLDERVDEQKHVKICGNIFGYLNIDTFTNKMSVGYQSETDYIKTKFTLKEIEQLKRREDIPLDWDKVKLEEAN